MADKPISGLTPVDRVKAADLFVLEQDGQARSVSGQTWVNWLTAYADGHGGIQSIAKTGTSGLVDTYTITLADGSTQTFTVTNGAKGDKGDQTHVYIRWSAVPNPSDNDLSDRPEAYIGICATTSETAPTAASAYAPWYRYKGETGDTGAPATLVSKSIQYMAADSGDVIPSGSWLDRIPVVEKGRYLWTRTTLNFNTGEPVVSYSVGRMGLDGNGSVNSVNGLTGDVVLRANNIKLQDSDFSVQTTLDQHQTAIDGKAAITNKNLLDNAWFLVAQTGYGGKHGAINYAADRWQLISGTVSYTTDEGLTLNGTIRQILENPVAGDVTASVRMTSGTATATYDNDTRYFEIASAGGTIRAAKLEHGSASTIANDHAPDYAIELMKCQRYGFAVPQFFQIFSYEGAIGGIYRDYILPVPVPMVSTPVLRLEDFMTGNATSLECAVSTPYTTWYRLRVYGGSFPPIIEPIHTAWIGVNM